MTLGVKWSQVQILSARPIFTQVNGHFGRPQSEKNRYPGGYVAQRVAQGLSSSPTEVIMQAAIMRDEVAVVTVLPGGKGHRGFDPSRADISWRTDDKTGR
jgi:hypothetical protein